MTERINARLDEALAGKLAELRARTGKSTTELIRASIESYFDQVTGNAGPGALLDDFVGCGEAEPELSDTYKSVLRESLALKVSDSRQARRLASRQPSQRRRKGTK
jgi:hypothetical protein